MRVRKLVRKRQKHKGKRERARGREVEAERAREQPESRCSGRLAVLRFTARFRAQLGCELLLWREAETER